MSVLQKVINVLRTNGYKVVNSFDAVIPGLCYVELTRIAREPEVSDLRKRAYIVDVYYGIRDLDKKVDEVEQIMDALAIGVQGVIGLTCDFQDRFAKITIEILTYA